MTQIIVIHHYPNFSPNPDVYIMQPILLYYANLLLCGLVFVELMFSMMKNPLLKVFLLGLISSLFVMNYFAIAGIGTRVEFMIVKFMRLVYVCSTLLALIHLVNGRIPKWFIALIICAGTTVTGLRIANYNQLNIESNISNQIFSVGTELYTPITGARYLILILSFVSVIIAYYYYRILVMKLNWESPQHKHLSRWIISLVVPYFLLTIFGILGNMGIFDASFSSYLFGFFSCATVCSFIFRPRFLDAGRIVAPIC